MVVSYFAPPHGAAHTHLRVATDPMGASREMSVPHYSPQLTQTMRDALETVMTNVPIDQATPGVKAHLAEIILQAAAQGLTTHDGLVAVASSQIQTVISMLT
jgi:hypothetical protein